MTSRGYHRRRACEAGDLASTGPAKRRPAHSARGSPPAERRTWPSCQPPAEPDTTLASRLDASARQSRHRYGTIPPPPPNHVHWGRRWGLVARSARSKGEPAESHVLLTLWCGPCGGAVTTRSAPILTACLQTRLVKGEPDRTASAPQVREQDRHSLNLGILHALRYAWSRSPRDRSFPRSGLG